jgi:hypothetical protein
MSDVRITLALAVAVVLCALSFAVSRMVTATLASLDAWPPATAPSRRALEGNAWELLGTRRRD